MQASPILQRDGSKTPTDGPRAPPIGTLNAWVCCPVWKRKVQTTAPGYWCHLGPGEGNGYLLQYSCLENYMDRGSWRATAHGVAKSQTRLSDFTYSGKELAC